MENFDSAFAIVTGLVKDFKENEKRYLSPEYQEAEVRRDFIDKFFEALGWDVYHSKQKNPYEQEVKVEKGVSIGKAQKRADYSFCISPNYRDTKFYVEAKKPSKNLYNPDYYFQAIRYGWNANTPIVILTDFEEFHIIDSRFKPDIRTALDRQIERYHYSEYLDKEKLSRIYYLLSREAVENNSIDKRAAELPKPRGKALQKGLIKGGYQSIDESFLEELDEIRLMLAKIFKKNNPGLTSEELTEATQRTIDRLVFMRFLEDKLIEGEHFVNEFGKRNSVWKDFITTSKRLDVKYNGVVFKNHPIIDSPTFKETDDSNFRLICERLSYENTPYDFNVIPIHILGSIYERFLGKIIHATDKQVRIEEKPEVRKAGGVYYTVLYIVRYIVDNTVGKIIEGKTPKEISKLRFIDISCGSGSFLIIIFDTLLHYIGKWYQEHPEQAKKDGCILKDGQWVLSLKQKREILLNNIYGVDIDSQAVEVTQLSLFLKLLEDETTATANEMQVLFKEKILPDLSKNIVCGNSLIGTDILDGKMFATVEERKLNPMDFEKRFPDIMKNGGFDVIVGNPPWGVNFSEIELDYLRKCYSNIIVRMIDSFMYFVYKSSILLKKTGYYGMILPDVILYQKDNIKLREFIIHNTQINNIINLGNGVFKNVNRPTCILIYINKFISNNIVNIFDLTNIKEKSLLLTNINYQLINQEKFCDLVDMNLITSGVSHYELLDKLYTRPHRMLKDYVDEDGIQRGISPDLKDAFIVSDELIVKNNLEKEFIKKTVTGGKQIKRYLLFDHHKNIIYTNRNTNYKNIPNICNFIDQYKNRITCVEVKQKKHSIYSLHRAREEKIFTKPEKIIGVITEDEIIVTIDTEYYYPTDGVYLFATKDIESKFLLSILNSKLFVFIYRLISMEAGRTLAQVKPTTISKLPIIIIDKSNVSIKDKLISLVNQMLETKKKLQTVRTDNDKTYYQNKCSVLDHAIDAEVYKLYALTEEEIKIVEGINLNG